MHAEARTTLFCMLENISEVFCFTRSISVCDCFQSVVFVNILQSSTEVLIYNSYLSTERKTFSGEALCQNKAGLLTSFSPRRLSHSAGLKQSKVRLGTVTLQGNQELLQNPELYTADSNVLFFICDTVWMFEMLSKQMKKSDHLKTDVGFHIQSQSTGRGL